MVSVNKEMQQNYVVIDTFKSALHVSGDSFAHLHEHFDCIYSFLGKCIDSATDRSAAESMHFPKKLYIQSKCS